MRNPLLPAGWQSTVAPIREGYVDKGGVNRGPSQIKTRPPAPGAIPPRRSAMPTDPLAPAAPDPTDRSR